MDNNTNDNSGSNDLFRSNNNNDDILQLDNYLRFDQQVQYNNQQPSQQQQQLSPGPSAYDFSGLAGEALTDFDFANGKSL